MKRDNVAVMVTMFVMLRMVQALPRAAAEQVSVTTGSTTVQIGNELLDATLSADRLHLTGLRLAEGGDLNLLQRVVTVYHTGQWQEEDGQRGYVRWETNLKRQDDSVVAFAQTSDAFFIHRRTVTVRAGAPYLEVHYSWHCLKTFHTASYYSIPDICFAKELDEAVWEGADGRVEKVLALKEGKESPAWEEAGGRYSSALAIGGHWFAARSTQREVGLLVFLPVREGVGARASTGYTWDPRLHLSIAPPMGHRPNPPMPGETVELRFFLMPFRSAAEDAAQALIKALNWKPPAPPRALPSALAYPLAKTSSLTLWRETITVKVMRTHQVPQGAARPVINLTAAKDEYEATQVVVTSRERLQGASLSAGDLVGATAGIPASDIEVNPVGYVRTASPPGEFPDILLPKTKVDIVPGRAQPFWVTVHVPRDVPAGQYRGSLRFTATGIEPVNITLQMTVYNFALPTERHLRAPFGFRPQYLSAPYGSEQGWKALEAYAREYRRARLSWGLQVTPGSSPRVIRDGAQFKVEGFDDFAERAEKLIREFASNTFPVLRFPAFPPDVRWEPPRQGHGRGDLKVTPEVEAVWRVWHREQQAALERKDILDKCYSFLVDEPVPEAIPNVKRLAQMTKAGAPRIKVLVTVAPTPELFGLVDIWYVTRTWPFFWTIERIGDVVPSMVPPLPESGTSSWSFDKAMKAMRERQAAGDQFWWGEFSCAELVAEGMEHRMLLWSTWRFGVQGLLYWSVNLWLENPWAGWDEASLTMRWARSFPASGDGILLYPGPTGDLPPVRSIRWELLREGMEDFEYLHLVQQIAGGKTAEARRAAVVLHKCRAVVYTHDRLRDYLRDPQTLYRLRNELAEVLAHKQRVAHADSSAPRRREKMSHGWRLSRINEG